MNKFEPTQITQEIYGGIIMSFAMSAINNNQYYAIAFAGTDSCQAKLNSETNFNINLFLGGSSYNCPQVQQQNNCNSFWSLDMAMTSAISQQNYPSYTNLNNIVAANEKGTITGDPHFRGGDGGTYDVQGEPGKVYNLLSDSNLNFNGRFDAWGSGGATVVGETSLNVANLGRSSFSTVTFTKDGVAKVNGQELQDGQSVILADGGTATKQGNKLTITTAEGYTITQTCHPSANGNYINTEVKTSALGVATDNILPGGLLGQTFDADNVARNGKKGAGAQGEGAIDGKVQDYETTLNNAGDVNLDPNGNVVQPYDPFMDLMNWLTGLLNPNPNKNFLDVLTFVMSGIFFLLAGGQNNQQY